MIFADKLIYDIHTPFFLEFIPISGGLTFRQDLFLPYSGTSDKIKLLLTNKTMSPKVKKSKTPHMAMIQIPLSAFRCISSYPKDKKVICEISVVELKRVNHPETLDEIMSESRFDYALGDYKTFENADDLIAELRA